MTLLRRLRGVTAGGTETDVLVDSAGALKQSLRRSTAVAVSLGVNGAQAVLPMDGFSSFTFTLRGTFTGCTVTLEQSCDSTDGTDGNWTPIVANRTDAAAFVSTTPLNAASSTTGTWNGYAPGATFVRARMTAYGTGTVLGTLVASPSSITPYIVAMLQGTSAVSGSITANPATGTNHNLLTTASNNLTSFVAAACSLMELTVFNNTAAIIYVKLYNKASAPVVASDTPIETIPVPIGGHVGLTFGEVGKRFSTGLAMAVTGAAAVTDATNVAAGAQINLTRV
jgi:hypothetical protein